MSADRPDYFDRYPTIAFDRDAEGILTLRIHSEGGPIVYSRQHHTDWSSAFRDVGQALLPADGADPDGPGSACARARQRSRRAGAADGACT